MAMNSNSSDNSKCIHDNIDNDNEIDYDNVECDFNHWMISAVIWNNDKNYIGSDHSGMDQNNDYDF